MVHRCTKRPTLGHAGDDFEVRSLHRWRDLRDLSTRSCGRGRARLDHGVVDGCFVPHCGTHRWPGSRATPLTICLVVIGRHVDRLKFLDVMFGDRPALTPPELVYQRMLAGDPVEAAEQ